MDQITGTAIAGATAPVDDADAAWRATANAWTITLRYQGRELTSPYWAGSGIGTFSAALVLEALASEASFGAETFEDYCAETGADADSRHAERMWNACRETAERMRTFLGDAYDSIVYAGPDDWPHNVVSHETINK